MRADKKDICYNGSLCAVTVQRFNFSNKIMLALATVINETENGVLDSPLKIAMMKKLPLVSSA